MILTRVTEDSLGFGHGLLAPLQGLRHALGSPSALRWTLVPALLFGAIFVTLMGLSVWSLPTLVHALVARFGATTFPWWGWLFGALSLVVAALVSLWTALALARACSGFALEALVRIRLEQRGVVLPQAPVPTSLARNVRLLVWPLLALGPSLLVLGILGLVLPFLALVTVPLQIVLTTWGVAWDLLDPVFAVVAPSMGVRERLRWMWRHRGLAFGLGLGAELTLLVPGLSLFALPLSVLGAADAVAKIPAALPRHA